jgi:hypothetical protein
MQNDMWSYSTQDVRDLEQFDVVATDGEIGRIDEATYDVGSSYIVVDTGPWIFGRKVVLPAGVIERIDLDNRNVALRLTKDQIQELPRVRPGYRGLPLRCLPAAGWDLLRRLPPLIGEYELSPSGEHLLPARAFLPVSPGR